MTFKDLNLNKPLLNALRDINITEPTSIQSKAFSVVMAGSDVLGIAQTGTGKTFAYLLPCLRQWAYSKEGFPQILVIVPTRELVAQVVEEVKKLTVYMNIVVEGVYGGTNIKTQMFAVSQHLDVLVGTPGRLLDLMLGGAVKTKSLKRVIIDEVDEMLELGFRTQLTNIFDLLPEKRQNLMFSATMTEDVEAIITDFFDKPVKIEAAPTGTPLENIQQMGYVLPNFYTKVNLLTMLLEQPEMKKVLVFVATKALADQLYDEIHKKFTIQLGVIHSNKAQNNRFNTVRQFHEGQYRILIATDIIARGLDVSEVSHVINFDTPDEAENYIHRIGRTGRADREGISITFITPKEKEYQTAIENLMNRKIPMRDLPTDLVISDVLTPDEIPKIVMKNDLGKMPKKEVENSAFHEKLAKNLKVNNKIPYKDKMMTKYGKKQTRGQKPRGKKK
jgi:ATP-dependent RNA helicase RhlE